LSADCRPLRRTLRPTVWVVLEEIALAADLDDNGCLVAPTSARQVAEHVGVNPTTAAEALRVLGRRGVISLEREKGPAGRFGLSVYQLCPPAGLYVVPPCVAEPYVVTPSMVPPDTAGAVALSPRMAAPHAESSSVEAPASGQPGRQAVGADTDPTVVASDPDCFGGTAGEGSPRRPRRSASSGSSGHCCGQTALDFGMGTSS
jgi:hypothetical protein